MRISTREVAKGLSEGLGLRLKIRLADVEEPCGFETGCCGTLRCLNRECEGLKTHGLRKPNPEGLKADMYYSLSTLIKRGVI